MDPSHRPITLKLNGQARQLNVDPQMPLLWALRENAGLTSTKFGCGIGQCGACTVHVERQAAHSCVLPVGNLQGQSVTTIEGLAPAQGQHVLQQAWLDLAVPQCGYCQSGMLMAPAALLARTPQPTDADIDAVITNLCRCGTYPRVRTAIHRAAAAVPAVAGAVK